MNGNVIEYKNTQSRKWRLVLLVTILTFLGTFVPTLLSAWVFESSNPLVILNGGHFVTLITLVVSAYFGANIWQKKVEGKFLNEKNNESVVENIETETKIVQADGNGEA